MCVPFRLAVPVRGRSARERLHRGRGPVKPEPRLPIYFGRRRVADFGGPGRAARPAEPSERPARGPAFRPAPGGDPRDVAADQAPGPVLGHPSVIPPFLTCHETSPIVSRYTHLAVARLLTKPALRGKDRRDAGKLTAGVSLAAPEKEGRRWETAARARRAPRRYRVNPAAGPGTVPPPGPCLNLTRRGKKRAADGGRRPVERCGGTG
jgi:hypothetical protein